MKISRRNVLALGSSMGLGAALFRSSHALAKPGPLPTDEPPPPKLALTGARLVESGKKPVDGVIIEIDQGKIVTVRAGKASGDIDVGGKTVTAGFVDLLTQTGLVEISLEESSRSTSDARRNDPIRAGFRSADGYDPASTVIPVTRLGGVTSVGVVPSGGLVSGKSAWADLQGRADDVAVGDLALHVQFEHAEGELASTGTVILRLRELFADAQAFKRNPAGYDRRQMRKLRASRIDLEAVASALDGKIPVVFHVNRASAILRVLELTKEYGIRPVLASAAEGWRVATAIARAKTPVIALPLDHGPLTFDARYAREDNAALLAKAGVAVALSVGETHNARKLAQVAGNAVRAGLSRDVALAGVTRAPAQIFGLTERYGSVSPGREANLVVWSGDPFELSTRVEHLIVRGRQVPLRSRQTALFERYR